MDESAKKVTPPPPRPAPSKNLFLRDTNFPVDVHNYYFLSRNMHQFCMNKTNFNLQQMFNEYDYININKLTVLIYHEPLINMII